MFCRINYNSSKKSKNGKCQPLVVVPNIKLEIANTETTRYKYRPIFGMCIIHSHSCTEEIHLLFICCLVSVFLLPSLPTCHFNTHLTQHICSLAILAHRCFLIFSFLLYLIPPGFAAEPPTTSLPCPSAANGAAHLLRQEV